MEVAKCHPFNGSVLCGVVENSLPLGIVLRSVVVSSFLRLMRSHWGVCVEMAKHRVMATSSVKNHSPVGSLCGSG